MPHTFELYIQQHSINVTYMGLDRCQIIGYSGLLDGVYTSYSCCCFYTWAAQLIRGVCSLDISFICSFRIVVSTAEEVDGVGDKGSGDAKRLMYIHFWRPFWTCLWDLSSKQQTFWAWNYSPQVLVYQDFWILRCQINKILMLWMQRFCKNYSSKIWILNWEESEHLVTQVMLH